MKRGFTLIELLAVIVILAIIALIAVPIVLNIINDVREASLIRSVELYFDAVSYSIQTELLKNNEVKDGLYKITSDSNLCYGEVNEGHCDSTSLIVAVDGGNNIKAGLVAIKDNRVIFASIAFDSGVVLKDYKDNFVYANKTNLKNNSLFQYDSGFYLTVTNLHEFGLTTDNSMNGYYVYKDSKIDEYNINFNSVRYDTYDEELEIVRVSEFDGEDDTAKINAAIDYVEQNGGKLLFEKDKTYTVFIDPNAPYETSDGLKAPAAVDINTNKKVVIDLNGSTIQLLGEGNGHYRYHVIRVLNCTDLTIQNGTIIGDRLDHDYSTEQKDEGGENIKNYAAQGYGIYIASEITFENKINVLVRDLEVYYMTGDGIAINQRMEEAGSSGKGLVILDNIKSHGHKRNGILFSSNDKGIIKNTKIYNVGDITDESVNPDALVGNKSSVGLDVEPEESNQGTPVKKINDLIVDNLVIENTKGYTIAAYLSERINNLKIYNSVFNGPLYLTKAKVFNTIIENNKLIPSNGFVIDKSSIYNSEIKNKNYTLNLTETNIYDSVLTNEGNKEYPIDATAGSIQNSKFNNVMYKVRKGNNSNNTYENSIVWVFTSDYEDQNSEFIGSTMKISHYKGEKLQNLKFKNSTITRGGNAADNIIFEKCDFDNVVFTHEKNANTYTQINFNDSNINILKFNAGCEYVLDETCIGRPIYENLVFNKSKISGIETDLKQIYIYDDASEGFKPTTLENLNLIETELVLQNLGNNFIGNSKFVCDNSIVTIKGSVFDESVIGNNFNNCTIYR